MDSLNDYLEVDISLDGRLEVALCDDNFRQNWRFNDSDWHIDLMLVDDQYLILIVYNDCGLDSSAISASSNRVLLSWPSVLGYLNSAYDTVCR